MSFETDLESLTHGHDFRHARHDDHARRTGLVVLLSALMMAAEVGAGFWYGSMALLADGVHMATHVGALLIALLAYRFAARHADNARFSFGTGKVGELAGFGSAVALLMVAFGIAWESTERLVDPQPVAFAEATLVAVLGLAVNLASAWLLGGGHHEHEAHHSHHDHGGAHHHGHHHGHDNNLRSALMHVLADAFTSVLAIAALLGGHYLGWLWLDAAMGLVGALVIAIWAVGLMRETGAVLLDATNAALAQDVRALVAEARAGRVADLHVWQVGPGAHALIVSLVGSSLPPQALRSRMLALPGVAHVTIEAWPEVTTPS